MSLLLLQLSPIILVIILILIIRRPPVQAAFAGVVLAFLLWIFGIAGPVSIQGTSIIVKDTFILFLSTAGVIIPGLGFVLLLERTNVPQAIGTWVQNLGWSPAAQIIFIVLGLAVLLESMTGFGVSLIATVPLLIGLFQRHIGMRIALAGMVIMPWGTLGLATLIGALLASVPADMLGSYSALVSAPVFFSLAAIALWIAGIRTHRAWLGLIAVSVLFSIILYWVNRWSGPTISGVLAGFSVLLAGLLLSVLRRKGFVKWPSVAWPYLALLIIILLTQGILTFTGWDTVWVIQGERVSWKPLSSPGIVLMLVIVLMLLQDRKISKFPWNSLYQRAKFPIATIFLFLLLSQIMVNGGFLMKAQGMLYQLSGISLAPTIAILAGLAGYVTGSNVGGNTLVMPSVAALVTNYGPWLAAIVNSAAGHGALGSLSILSLITGLAAASPKEENSLIRFAFGLVLLNITIVSITGMAIFYIIDTQ